MRKTKKVLIGVTGGIAAYKIPDLVRLLRKKDMQVRIAMTKNAERFVTPTTLETVSGHKVWTADWENYENPLEHLNESLNCNLALIAPATANFIGKLAAGIADDVLSTVLLALPCPVFIAPSMNPRMFANPAVVENIETLKKRGYQIIHPDEGEMACGETGEGRLPELSRLVFIVENALGLESSLEGLKILVTAGRTEEPIDAVRYISNRSSGKMGISIATAARERGAEVTLIHGPVSEKLPETTLNVAARRAEEMYKEVLDRFKDCNVLIMTAAIADFRPAQTFEGKRKKKEIEKSIKLVENPDILETIGREKDGRILVGFAAETGNLVENSREKMLRKNIDIICVNDVSRDDIGFESDFNEITFIDSTGEPHKSGRLPKITLAHQLLDRVLELAKSKNIVLDNKNG